MQSSARRRTTTRSARFASTQIPSSPGRNVRRAITAATNAELRACVGSSCASAVSAVSTACFGRLHVDPDVGREVQLVTAERVREHSVAEVRRGQHRAQLGDHDRQALLPASRVALRPRADRRARRGERAAGARRAGTPRPIGPGGRAGSTSSIAMSPTSMRTRSVRWARIPICPFRSDNPSDNRTITAR